MPSKLIVYACPLGALAQRIDSFYARSAAEVGKNTAHRYPPHITLTGFFHDEPASVPRYTAALEQALERARPTRPELPFTITALEINSYFVGLLLNSPWAEGLIADFAATVVSPTRHDALRLKSNLHLSLAYSFPPEQQAPLTTLAHELVDLSLPVAWELRFYEQLKEEWICHARWAL